MKNSIPVPNPSTRLSRSRGAKYRLSGGSDHRLVRILLLLPGAELNVLSRLHAKIQIELAEQANGTKPGRCTQSSTMRIAVRYLLELMRKSARFDELCVDVSCRLLSDYNATTKEEKTIIEVFLFREDLPLLLPLQSDLTLKGIHGTRNLVLRCALEFLRSAAEKPRGWSSVVTLAHQLPK